MSENLKETRRQFRSATKRILYRRTKTQLIRLIEQHCWDAVSEQLAEETLRYLDDKRLLKLLPDLISQVHASINREEDEVGYGHCNVTHPRDFIPDLDNPQETVIGWARDVTDVEYDIKATVNNLYGEKFHIATPRWGMGTNIYRGAKLQEWPWEKSDTPEASS